MEGKIDAELLMYDVSLCRRELSNVQINVAQDFLTERDEHFCLYERPTFTQDSLRSFIFVLNLSIVQTRDLIG